MFVALVTGSVVATQKTESMTGHKLLVVEPYRLDEKTRSTLVSTGRTFIAVDTLGAGEGQFVLVTQGSSARRRPLARTRPTASAPWPTASPPSWTPRGRRRGCSRRLAAAASAR